MGVYWLLLAVSRTSFLISQCADMTYSVHLMIVMSVILSGFNAVLFFLFIYSPPIAAPCLLPLLDTRLLCVLVFVFFGILVLCSVDWSLFRGVSICSLFLAVIISLCLLFSWCFF